jgi:inner membrane protein
VTGALAAIAVLVADGVARLREWPRPVAGVIDEAAHVATGLVLLASSPRPVPDDHAAGVIAGSVLLDLDHVPELFGVGVLRNGTSRPVPHSLVTVLALARNARGHGWPTPGVARGAAVGVAAHLVRDLATGNGVQLLWPLSRRVFAIPYGVYAGLLIAAAAVSARPAPSSPAPGARSAVTAPAPPPVPSSP